ncbi:MAG: cysteine hydrolase, partial [bacterium]|nr:cysteine hydrolase [bacterium]
SEIVPTAKAVLDLCRSLGIHVIHTKEAHKSDLSDCPVSKRNRGNPTLRIGDAGAMGRLLIEGEPGTDFIPEMAPSDKETVIIKPGKGAFYATELLNILQEMGITQLIIIGVTTEVCVQTTMREANDRGFECLLIEDATASYFPEFKRAVIAMIIAQGGIVGWVTTFDELHAGFTT